MGSSVVVLESDPRVAQSLAGKLSSQFRVVHLTRSGDELRQQSPTAGLRPWSSIWNTAG
jgi:hypothetical protein